MIVWWSGCYFCGLFGSVCFDRYLIGSLGMGVLGGREVCPMTVLWKRAHRDVLRHLPCPVASAQELNTLCLAGMVPRTAKRTTRGSLG